MSGCAKQKRDYYETWVCECVGVCQAWVRLPLSEINQAANCLCGYWQQLSIDSACYCYDPKCSYIFYVYCRKSANSWAVCCVQAVRCYAMRAFAEDIVRFYGDFFRPGQSQMHSWLCRLPLLLPNARICFIQQTFLVFIATIFFLAFNAANDASSIKTQINITSLSIFVWMRPSTHPNRQQLLAHNENCLLCAECGPFPWIQRSSAR